MPRSIDCWLSVDGYPAEIQLPTELQLQLHALAKENELINVAPKVPVTGRLAVVIGDALQRAVEPVTEGPLMTAVMFGRGAVERLVIYFVNRDPSNTLASMQQQGWQVLGQRQIPQPFAACQRVMVYHGDELLKAQP